MVGVGAKDNDLSDGVLGEQGYPCPPFCAMSNGLDRAALPDAKGVTPRVAEIAEMKLAEVSAAG
jgi:hypothetical protein